MTGSRNVFASTALGLLVAVACTLPAADAQVTGYKQGSASGKVTGGAGTDGATGDNGVEKCPKPMGAVAVVEPQDMVISSLRGYGLGSPVGLLRMMIQQSNCFIVVERGVGMQNAMQERELAASGEARAGSNMGKGQMDRAKAALRDLYGMNQADFSVGWRQLTHLASRLASSVNEKVPFGTNIEVPAQMDGQLHQVNIGKATICQQHDLAMKREQTTGFFQDRFVLAETDACTAMFQDFPCQWQGASTIDQGYTNDDISFP